MSIITSEARFRQRVLKYSFKYGVKLSPIIDNLTRKMSEKYFNY